jgi:hypothetical protein
MEYTVTFSQYLRDDYNWSDAQVIANVVVPKITGAISCSGSGYIIYDVLKNPIKRKKPYHRIVLGMSVIDCFSSFFLYFLSSWPEPRGYHVYAYGNDATCDAQGFLGNIGIIGVPLYNCSLATFYLLVLKYEWTDGRMRRIEKWFHIIPWLISLSFSCVALAFNSFMGVSWFCW